MQAIVKVQYRKGILNNRPMALCLILLLAKPLPNEIIKVLLQKQTWDCQV